VKKVSSGFVHVGGGQRIKNGGKRRHRGGGASMGGCTVVQGPLAPEKKEKKINEDEEGRRDGEEGTNPETRKILTKRKVQNRGERST